MSTVTLTYNPNDTFVQSILKMLRESGVFKLSEEHIMPDEEWTEAEERDAFLYTSKVNASRMFAKYL